MEENLNNTKSFPLTLIQEILKSRTTLASRLYREYCLANNIEADVFIEVLLNNLYLESQDYEKIINTIIRDQQPPRLLSKEELKKSLGKF